MENGWCIIRLAKRAEGEQRGGRERRERERGRGGVKAARQSKESGGGERGGKRLIGLGSGGRVGREGAVVGRERKSEEKREA